MDRKVIVNCAITGAVHVPSQSPYLPVTPDAIVAEAIAAADAGAATVHLHARDRETGQPTSDVSLFTQMCEEISSQSDVVICITTGGSLLMTAEERMGAVRRLKPELASVNMGSFNFGIFPATSKIQDYKFSWEKPYLENSKDLIFKNTFSDQERIFKMMEDTGTKPELECYDVGHLYNIAYWADRGVLTPPFWVQFIFGVMGSIQPSLRNLLFVKETADELFGRDYIFSVLGCGRHEFSLGTVGVLAGGNVRVGLEDNLYIGKGELAKSNADMVAKVVRILHEFGFQAASPDHVRDVLGLKGAAQTGFAAVE